MSSFLQFAFLGCHGSYLASVTKLHSSNFPLEKSDIVCFGLPAEFSDTLKRGARYNFNVRGHDFLAHVGQWRGSTHSGTLDARSNMIGEIQELGSFVTAVQNAGTGGNAEDMLLSFGPAPGSFFADDRRTRYRWRRLPDGLEDSLQRIISQHGYGKISDVAINAAGGWVVQLGRGAEYEFGDPLPEGLRSALENGRKRGGIKRLYLNHQNQQEYVLIFEEGKTSICLHADFEEPFKALVKQALHKRDLLWRPARDAMQWEFEASCNCSEPERRHRNAAYYNRRGKFQLFRGNSELALKYLREALRLDKEPLYRADYGMALIAVETHRKDPVLKELIEQGPGSEVTLHDPSDDGFRNDYINLIHRRPGAHVHYSARLEQARSSAEGPYWSYSMGIQAFPHPPPPPPTPDSTGEGAASRVRSAWGERGSTASL